MSKPELIAADAHLASCHECREMLGDRTGLSIRIASLRGDLDKALEAEHVDYPQLEAYVDQQLGAEERNALDRHVAICSSCAEELRDLQGFKKQLGQQHATGLPAAASDSAPALSRPRVFSFPGGWPAGRRWALAACAVIAIGVATRWLWVRQHSATTMVQNSISTPTPQAAQVTVPAPTPPAGNTPTENTLASFSFLPGGLRRIVADAMKDQRLPTPPGLADLAVRRGEDGIFPLISPVGAVVESATPLFKWQPTPNADGYRVKLNEPGQDAVESSAIVTGTSWKSVVTLRRGATYVWRVVVIRNGEEVPESPLDAPQARFQVLDESQSREVQRLKNNYPQEHFARGVLLAHAGVLDEAAEQFHAVPPSDPHHELAARFEQQARVLIARLHGGLPQ